MTSDLLAVQRKLLPKAKVIFDVGTQTGETAIAYAEVFSDSIIYAFEPEAHNAH